jgi:hypothetical protein
MEQNIVTKHTKPNLTTQNTHVKITEQIVIGLPQLSRHLFY